MDHGRFLLLAGAGFGALVCLAAIVGAENDKDNQGFYQQEAEEDERQAKSEEQNAQLAANEENYTEAANEQKEQEATAERHVAEVAEKA